MFVKPLVNIIISITKKLLAHILNKVHKNIQKNLHYISESFNVNKKIFN